MLKLNKIFILFLFPGFLNSFEKRSTDFKIPTKFWTDEEFEKMMQQANFFCTENNEETDEDLKIIFKGKSWHFKKLQERIVICDCGKKLPISFIWKHLDMHNPERGQFSCNLCKIPLYFKNKRSFHIHLTQTHKNRNL